MIVNRVGPVSFAKVAGTLYAILGLMFGAVISLVSLVGLFAFSGSEPGPFQGMFGVAAVVVLPLFYGYLGFVMTLIMAALYNLIAGVVGGVEVDLR